MIKMMAAQSSSSSRARKPSSNCLPSEREDPRSDTPAGNMARRAPGKSPTASQVARVLLTLGCWQLVHWAGRCEAAKLPDIYWNSSNPIFRIDNTDHIFDVNKKQNDHDQVDLVCPQPEQRPANLSQSGPDSAAQQPERYIIYSVSKEEYDTCRLTGNPRVVALCDQTSGKNRPPFTVTFRPFTPQPNGLEFRAGQDYYFISALPGNPNDPKRFSPCRDLNMRVIFKVCCKSPAPAASPSTGTPQPARPLPPLASLLPAYPQPSTRRPVMTLRPSLPSQAPPQQKTPGQPQRQPLEDYLRTLAPSGGPFPQVPVTVLPIEVLQPSTSEPPSEPADSERNDIVQNEQQPSSTARPPPPPFPHFPPHAAPAPRPAAERPVLRGFDPRLSPNQLLPRWQPTPLPASITQRRPEPAPQHLPPTRHDLYSHNIISWPTSYDPSRAFGRDLTMMEPTSACASLRPGLGLALALCLALLCLQDARYRFRWLH